VIFLLTLRDFSPCLQCRVQSILQPYLKQVFMTNINPVIVVIAAIAVIHAGVVLTLIKRSKNENNIVE
jgi:hypothetical protein